MVVANTNNSVSGNKTASSTSSVATVTVNALINAVMPNITGQPQGASYAQGATAAALTVTASVSDSGTRSYQWYSNTVNSNSGGTAISGATSATYTPPTTTASTVYYYVVVTNTNNSVNGTKTASVTSNTAAITVFVPGNAGLTITFNQISDAAPAITGPTIYRFSNSSLSTATITVENPGQYSSISWRVQDTTVTGTGTSFTLSASNAAYNLFGEHFITVSVIKNGAPYNKTVSFTVAY